MVYEWFQAIRPPDNRLSDGINMQKTHSSRRSLVLIILIVIGLVYSSLINLHVPLTSRYQWDGLLGVLYGLYACSHPAANVLDMLFYARGAHRQGFSVPAYRLFWGLNLLVLLVGWYDIFTGLLRFTAAR